MGRCGRLWVVFLAFGIYAAARAAEVPVARFAGRVVDAEGRPAEAVRIWLGVTERSNSDLVLPMRELAATGPDGRFAASIPQTPVEQGRGGKRPWPKRWRYQVWAHKPGSGVGWARAKGGEEVEIQLSRPATLRGTVLNAEGAPLAGVTVGVYETIWPGGPQERDRFVPGGSPWAKAQTDAKGGFALTDLPAGAMVRLYVENSAAPGREWGDEWPPDLREVKLTKPVNELTIRLVRTPTIAGWLVLAGGKKAPAVHTGIRATARRVADPPFQQYAFWASTDEHGRYRFVHLIPGIYTIWVGGGEYTGVVARDIEVKQDQRLELPPVTLRHNIWVEGRVLDADTGAPVGGAGLTVGRRDVPNPGASMVGQAGESGPDGWFRANAPPTEVTIWADGMQGDYRATYRVERVVVDGRPWLRVEPAKRKPSYRQLSLKPGPTATGVNLYLKRCARLAGRVVGPDGNPWVGSRDGSLLPSQRVYVSLDRDRVQSRMASLPSAPISPDGTFIADRLYAGVPIVLTVFDDHTEVGGAVRVTPQLDQNAEVVIRLEPTAHVTGRVVMPDGKPVEDASVGLGYVAAHDDTDAEGRFDVPGAIPGLSRTVSVQAWSSPDHRLVLTGTSKTVEITPRQKVVDVGDIVLAPERRPAPE